MTSEEPRLPEGHEKDVHYQGVIVGIPTFGKVSANFLMSSIGMFLPIFTNIGYHIVQGKPVDIARNEIAWTALQNKTAFVLFRDDDTICPRDALTRMIDRLPIKEKTYPYEHGNTIIGGVVYSKNQPPVPMIHKEGYTAAFEDWNPGDLIECDVIGMGCTLIPVGVFAKLLPHIKHFRCVNDLCLEPWGEYKDLSTCPKCNSPLVPQFFKTIRDGNCADMPGSPFICTEDSYLCILAKRTTGAKVYCDAGVITEHEVFHPSPRNTVYYGHYGSIGPAWRVLDQIFYYPPISDDTLSKGLPARMEKAKANGDFKLNLGSGGVNIPGYLNVDSNPAVNPDFVCDATNLDSLVNEKGFPIEIRAHHLLEHVHRDAVVGTVRSWLRYLKPRGVLDIEVPDGLWAMKQAVDRAENANDIDHWPEMVLFGACRWVGDEHRTIFYRKKMEALVKACKNQVESYTIEEVPVGNILPDSPSMCLNQSVLRVKITKKSVEVPDAVEVVDSVSSDATPVPQLVQGG
jgi:predicted SAM-dependent methyltransferase